MAGRGGIVADRPTDPYGVKPYPYANPIQNVILGAYLVILRFAQDDNPVPQRKRTRQFADKGS
jgi:hypothetical protein